MHDRLCDRVFFVDNSDPTRRDKFDILLQVDHADHIDTGNYFGLECHTHRSLTLGRRTVQSSSLERAFESLPMEPRLKAFLEQEIKSDSIHPHTIYHYGERDERYDSPAPHSSL